MKNIITSIILALISFYVFSNAASGKDTDPGKVTLSGKITDKATGEAVPGVYVYIPDLKTGAVTDKWQLQHRQSAGYEGACPGKLCRVQEHS